MSDSVSDDPGWKAFADRAIKELVPMVDDSAYCVSLIPRKPEDRSDIKFCLELGLMLMLDKPIIMVIAPGSKVPDKVVQVADAIIEMNTNDEKFMDRLKATIDEVQARLGLDS